MKLERLPKQAIEKEVLGKRPKSRSRYKWEDQVKIEIEKGE